MGERFLRIVYRDLIQPHEPTLRALGLHLLTSDGSTVFVAEKAGEVLGMIGLMAYPHPMSGERTVAEVMWWVQPESRGCGLRLLRAGEDWAREQGATVLQMIAPSPETERLYERLGYVPVERTYQRRLMS